jgi:two-component system, cell cycle sensor histidine kinase and response regulator CckA
MLRQAPDMTARHQADLDQIELAAERAQKLTRQLLAFARRQILQPRVFDIDEAVGHVAPLLRKLVPENVELTINRPRPGGMILMDPSQFEQILINLAVNAGDAMPRGGRLTIETGTEILDEQYQARHGQVAPGRYVVLTVADTGTGMDEATAKQAFEPFFTTKDVGKGTGLGLATVHGIVKQSGGDIWLYTEPGHGTTFRIYLPEATGTPQPEAELAMSAAPTSAGGSETILVVEDDEAVRPLVCMSLARAGYRVIEACNPKDAARVASEFAGRIDLLLSDVIMPESDGPALHGLLRATHPELRVLYMSGYADDAIVRQGILVEGTPFIQKPFAPRALAAKVRETLDA